MTNDHPQPENPMDRFTRAVKTIVNVPKSAIHKKGEMVRSEEESTDDYDVYVCPDCGHKVIVPKGQRHEKHTHG